MSWKNKPLFCRTCEAHQVKTEIYFDNEHKSQAGKSIPMEKNTRQPHQCQFSPYAMKQKGDFVGSTKVGVYSPQQEEKEFVDNRGYMEQPKQQEQYKITSPNQYIPEPQNYNEHFKILEDKIGQITQRLDEFLSDATNTENRILREQVRQFEQVIANHEKSFQPANKVQSEPDIEPQAIQAEAENEHVRRMMRKGETNEELDLND